MEKSRAKAQGERKRSWRHTTCGWYVPAYDLPHPLTLAQRKREREYQRLRKEAEEKQELFLDWAQRFEAKAGPSWRPKDDGAF